MKRLLTKTTVLLSAATMLLFPFSLTAIAGKEGVFINQSVYFTLDHVTLTSGADNGSLRFTLELNNDSEQVIDFNRYGVKIVDDSGASYSAQLSLKGEARVKPNQIQEYKFISQIPLDVTADELKVELFQWDSGSSSYMRGIGALSVASAMDHNLSTSQQLVLNMQDVDATLPGDALVSAELGNSYRIYKDGAWIVYSDIWLQNLGSTSYKLPTTLEYTLVDSSGYQYEAELILGASGTLLPKQRTKVKLQAAIPDALTGEGLTLQFTYKAVEETITIGSLNVSSSMQIAEVGEEVVYPSSNTEGIVVKNSWSSVTRQTDGVRVQSHITVSNKGSRVLSVPNLSAEFQTKKGTVTVASTDNSKRSAYLSPGDITTYRFSGVLPVGLKAEDIQLVILDQPSTSTSTAQGSQQGTGQQTTQPNTTSSSLPVFVASLSKAGTGITTNAFSEAAPYTLGTVLPFDTNNSIDSNLEISLVELHMHDNEEFGYSTAIAKYKLSNKGTTAVPMPKLETELASAKGFTYSGTRQASAAEQVLPNTSYVLSYSYLIPPSEVGDDLAMNFYDENQTDIGSFRVKPQELEEEGAISFYPFDVNIKDYRVSATYSSSTYAYKLWVDLDIQRQEEVIVDANFSKLTFEVNDVFGRVLSSLTMPFIGAGKVISGVQTLNLGSVKTEQLESIVTINVYEQIETPNGVVKRLVKVIKT
jgi:hypothetical protein